jgi:drug/metabolite transporter (DMT)-like permease
MQGYIPGFLFALSAAVSWGGGDFCGGFAARKTNHFQVLFLTSISSLVILVLCALLWDEGALSPEIIIYSIIAGVSGAVGLASLYKGLALGQSAQVAPVAGVIGALFPMLVGVLTEGAPGLTQIIGFGAALVGIWFVSMVKAGNPRRDNKTFHLAVLAGLGFGGYLVLVAQFGGERIFTPLAIAKLSSLSAALLLLRTNRQTIPKLTTPPAALLSGLLDSGGNILYILAVNSTRLDIAAAISSLYPAATVLLSTIILKEKVTVIQSVGVIFCILAIILITG